MYTRKCAICGAEFETSSSCKKYCSNACYLQSKRKSVDTVVPITEKTASAKRKCHDCGKPTVNYRCESCWEKIRAREVNW